ncbi:MAG: acetylornithine aminotransferase [Candidatus Xenolissoclinum pacificiensis L6]|uniref:Acetylornithine aminotransferase n=1 Tax=Candidatus Xenolissoclinum pacificiensis L6 TaxID=1401685 RepID=W2UZP2_9RICK|nr:MAG: acetylornithine aminotransferase [Candidatus Xenolissoclinum pacificiensis L6]
MYNNIVDIYNRYPVEVSHAQGIYLYTSTGNKILDFSSGISVVSLGHNNQELNSALIQQTNKIWYSSNVVHNSIQNRVADLLTKHTFADNVFFCSSGLEANEAAIKFARKYGMQNDQRYEIISFDNSFHGRSMACISASGLGHVKKDYPPLLPGFKVIPVNDFELLSRTITNNTVAIMVEAIQSEGGINVIETEFLYRIYQICQEKDILLILDEVQTGFCRTGTLFIYEQFNIIPDIITIAKAMGNGFPVGGCLVNKKIANLLSPGCHGSTYGGNQLAMSVTAKVLEIMLRDSFLINVNNMSKILHKRLLSIRNHHPKFIKNIKGLGMLLGIEFTDTVKITSLLDILLLECNLLLTKTAHPNTIRITPSLIINASHIDEFAISLEKGINIYQNRM